MKKYIIILLLITILSSCNYFKLMNNQEWMESTQNDDIDVYASGQYFNGSNNVLIILINILI